MAPDDDDLFDEYLDACLAGRVEEPAAFVSRAGGARPALLARLEALRALRSEPEEPAAVRPDAGLPFVRLGDFRLLERLDEGGMGSVFLARQESLGREVALKLLRPEFRDSAHAEERFRREAQAVARLRHPNVVTVHAVGEDQGVRFLAMELVRGRSLDEIVAEATAAGRTLPAARVLGWGAEIARALHCAHEAGIVHRDVKPSNVRITEDGRAMLLDFGIARDAATAVPALTATFAGSPLYAAPEQLCGAEVDARADVYALGVTLYHALTGRVPFAGESVEQVIGRALVETAISIRRLRPEVTRDAETVVAKAMEREPERRFETALRFAEDLDAAASGGPIRARPPSPLRRAATWTRRHAVAAAVLVTLIVALTTVAFVAAHGRRAERTARGREARIALDDARSRLEAHRSRSSEAKRIEGSVSEMHTTARSRYLTDEEEAKLRADEDAARALRRTRETIVYEVLERLRTADQLDPGLASETDAARADVYLEKWRGARAAGDVPAATFWRARVEEFDHERRLAAELRPSRSLRIRTQPPGAEVHLFRYRDLAEVSSSDEHRLVPVPARGEPPVTAAPWALRVARGAGVVETGDHIVAVEGRPVAGADDLAAATPGARAAVVRNGVVSDVTLPPGLVLRPTAAAAMPSAASCVGASPTPELVLEADQYLVLALLPGFEPARIAFASDRGPGSGNLELVLVPQEAVPAGFVTVCGLDQIRRVAMSECEVTCAEYLEFLNDPATRARIDAAAEPVFFPRSYDNRRDGGSWPRGADGAFSLPASWDARWPVLGVSFDDARAYAAWRTRMARDAGRRETYRLPRLDEWGDAAGGNLRREFPFGDRFSARWTKSCFSRETASPEPVMTFATDESPYGIFDMAGSAAEWVDAWFDEKSETRRFCGSSWAQAEPLLFRIWAAGGLAPGASSNETGIRLVAELPELAR